MKTLHLCCSAALLLGTGLAFADTGPMTRQEVLADLAQSRTSGDIMTKNSEDSADFLRRDSVSSLTRKQVRQELEISRIDGSFAALNSEDGADFGRRYREASGTTRAEVRAELRRARADGDMKNQSAEDGGYSRNEISAE